MSDLIAQHADLPAADVEWLHLLVGDWQVVSDLAFAAVAQCRPSTGATVHYDDIVGSNAPEGQRPQLAAAMTEVRSQRSREPRWFGAYAVREEAVPVVHEGRPIAVVARQTNLGSGRTPSRLELNYVEAADDLLAMIARGEYPSPNAATGPRRGAPRVGDGLIRLNSEGEVLYASPNALSCFHRLGVIGPLVGQSLVEVTTGIVEHQSTVDESMPLVVMGRAPWRTDIEAAGVALSLRALPLTDHGQRIGAVLLCRDVSELRRRERELMTKDATIREIHHRVKNNLATVAALLRLQARRMDVPEARVELDDMLSRALRLAADVASTATRVRTKQTGSFGMVPAQDATPLALVLTELVTNAVEHAFPGRDAGMVEIDVERSGSSLRVVVGDDGVGMPDGIGALGRASTSGLGSQIVQTLVTNELGGTIAWRSREGGGTQVVLELELREGQSSK